MVNLTKSVLLFGLILLLTNCAAAVKEISTYKVEKKKEPLSLPALSPLELQDVKWVIITKDNAEEVFEQLKADGNDYALFALTDKGYEQLALNIADIRTALAMQRQIIISYQEYYEGGE
tara:strand:- start:419 stop:775 length:357 start_codon:yes stop_codon:yes gene_type:complete